MKIIVGRHVNGICLNDLEYILDAKGYIKRFKNEESARKWLIAHGATEENLHYMTFKKVANNPRISTSKKIKAWIAGMTAQDATNQIIKMIQNNYRRRQK